MHQIVSTSLALFLLGFLSFGAWAAPTRPNVVIVLLDDLGFSDLGFLGSEISTPAIDSLAAGGITVTNFYTHPRCSPTRAALLTGRYPHEVGLGFLTTPAHVDPEPGPYQGYLATDTTTLAEALRQSGYGTYMSGKWHLGEHPRHWPRQHGFDRYFGLISGASSYYELLDNQPFKRQMALDDNPWKPTDDNFYMTEAFTRHAEVFLSNHFERAADRPFFLYLAYTAPHWPLHAPETAVASYRGLYDAGPEAIMTDRKRRLAEKNLVLDPSSAMPDLDDENNWPDRMAVYAAQVTLADQGIGRIVKLLRDSGQLENTLILVLSDNGASAEDVSGRKLHREGTAAGAKGSYLAYGPNWATVSNTPFRAHKGSTYEGGIRSPLLLSWPEGISAGGIIDQVSVLAVEDILPTVLTAAGVKLPPNTRGENFASVLNRQDFQRSKPLFWEHVGWGAAREGPWKAVYEPEMKQWQLFNLHKDPGEHHDRAGSDRETLNRLTADWQAWSDEIGTAGFDIQTFMNYFRPPESKQQK